MLKPLIVIDRNFLFAFVKLQKVTIYFVTSVRLSFRPSVRPHGTTRLALQGFLWNLIFEYFSQVCRENSGLFEIGKELPSNLHEDQCKFMTTSPWVILRIGNFSDRICRENQNAHFSFKFFFFENLAVYEIMWQNVIESDRPQLTIQYGACVLHAG